MNRTFNIGVLLLLLVATTACGFNMRGMGRESGSQLVGQLYVEGEGSVLSDLRNALTAQQVQFALFRKDADTLVIVNNELRDRREASINSSGRVSEYELLHSIELLTLRPTEGVKAGLLEPAQYNKQPQTVSVIRDYTYDETNVLGKDDEESILREEMSDELVRHLVLRIFAGSM